jgi:chromosome partitioning protein
VTLHEQKYREASRTLRVSRNIRRVSSMNVLAFASRKGGTGKSTLVAHLAAHRHTPTRPCLLIDDDPQGSLTLWNELRGESRLPLKIVKRDMGQTIKKAKQKGFAWVLIDTPPNTSASVVEAIEAATLVIIPCRPGLFDIDAVQETVALARNARTPYAVVFNAAPPRREHLEAPAVWVARNCLSEWHVPVWGGQITHRASFSLALTDEDGVKGYQSDPGAAAEIAGLWSAIDKSVAVIRGTRDKPAMHRVAA